MASPDPKSISSNDQARLQKVLQASRMDQLQAIQDDSKELSLEVAEQGLFNPLAMRKNAETLETRRAKRPDQTSGKEEDEDKEHKLVQAVTKTAEDFQEKNSELDKRSLLGLKTIISSKDSPEEILRKVLKSYPDHFLADEAFEFLLQTTDPKSTLGANILLAKQLLSERFGREIKAGRNINEEAKAYVKQGIGNAGSLRDLYRDVTGNPREPLSLFEELSEAYPFDKMKSVLQFLLHSIGSDLKSKGPSIAHGELHRLFNEVRTMQAILGIYRFFFQRMRLIELSFSRASINFPKDLNFEALSKQYARFIQEKYPSPDKLLKLAQLLGIAEEIAAQVIVFTQFRDALRGTSPKLFKSDKHREDLLLTLIETISELDDLLEEEEEIEEEKKKPGWSEKDTLE